jgi:hypothetical protein
MVKTKKSEILKIARDIINHGLNGSTFPIVYQNPEGECIVKDGNRRVTALKAIHNPKSIKGNDTLKNQFEQLRQKSNGGPNKVMCAVYFDEDDADYWTEHNHLGSIGGIGKQEWSAEMKKRYRMYRTGTPDPTMEIYDLGVKEMNDFEELQTAPSITTIERMVSFRSVREELGFKVVDRRIEISVSREDFIRDWKFIFEQLGNKVINVDTVKTSDKARQWIARMRKEAQVHGERTFSSSQAVEPAYLTPATPHPEPVEEFPKSEEPTATIPSVAPTQKRRTLIPKYCDMNINQTRINNIYSELKGADVHKLVNLTAISLRVFLELNVDYHLLNNPEIRISDGKKGYLHSRLQVVAEDLYNKGKITKDVYDALKKACTANAYSMEITTELNQYVHNLHMNPDSRSLKDLWDNIESFIKAIWAN